MHTQLDIDIDMGPPPLNNNLSTTSYFALVIELALHQKHMRRMPHSQQNLADSTGYLVPHEWQNLLLTPPLFTASTPPSLRGEGRGRRGVELERQPWGGRGFATPCGG